MIERRHLFPFFLLVIAAALLLLTKVVYSSANDLSRFFTIRSLVEHQTLVIYPETEREYADTIYLPDRGWYSDKPPLLSFIAVGIFLILRSVGILSLPVLSGHPNANYYLLTLIISGLPLVFYFFLWRSMISRLSLSPLWQNFWLLMAAGGTLLLPFATVFSNHVITASLAFTTFYLTFTKAQTKKNLCLLGLLTGIIPAIDLPFGAVWLLIVTAIIWPRLEKKYYYYFLALIPGLALMLILNWLASGSILPMYLVAKQYLSLPQNSWRTDLTLQSPLQILLNVIRALFGWSKGLFIYTPILLLGFWALLRNGQSLLHRYQRLILFWGSLAYIFGVIALTNDLGGAAYGLRWALPLIPIWL